MKYERILLDIETQRDFFGRGGSCFSSQTREAGVKIVRLFAWCISTMEISSIAERHPGPEHGPSDPPA